MKGTLYIFVILLIVGIVSCESPLNVPANRNIEIKEDPFLNPPISLSPSYINLGFVHPDSQVSFSIEIQNNLDKQYIVWDYNLYFLTNGFSIVEKSIPLNLEPKGAEKSKSKIDFIYKAERSGIYYDTLLIANLIYPFSFMVATVPNIYMDDVIFEGNGPSEKNVTIHNLSESNFTITNATFSNPTSFKLLDTLPILINRNSVYNMRISYFPSIDETQESSLIINVSGLADKRLADTVCKIIIIK